MTAVMIESTGPSAQVLTARLCQVAVDLDVLVRQLERLYLSGGEGMLLSVPALHVEISFGRLEELIAETERLDDRPRLIRLQELRGELDEAA